MSDLSCFATYGLNELLRNAASRGVSFGFERSVRLHSSCFETRRCLYSFAKNDFGPEAINVVLHVCRTMNAPAGLLQSVNRFFSAAAYVHFGFECSGDLRIGKCYLELPEQNSGWTASSGRLQFLGFKWSMNEESVVVVTRYRMIAKRSWDDVEELLLKNTGTDLRIVMESLLSRIRPIDSTSSPECSLLEIEEEGSHRRSYDLNIYNFEIKVREIAPLLPQLADSLQLNIKLLQTWMDKFEAAPLGHIAIGQGRDLQSFLTLYHGDR